MNKEPHNQNVKVQCQKGEDIFLSSAASKANYTG